MFVCLFVCEIVDNCYAKRYIRIIALEIYIIYTLGSKIKFREETVHYRIIIVNHFHNENYVDCDYCS